MASSADRTITFILLVLGAVICVQAQTTTQKAANASVSGQVTIKGKPAVGIVIIAREARDKFSSTMSGHRARTDQTGSYRFTNLSAGTYAISPITPALVPAHDSDSVVVADGEEVQDINSLLVPGGVITGKITDFEGEPVIGQQVSISPVYQQIPSRFSNTPMPRFFFDNMTDDRGVYRAFGLPRGRYKVSVGESDRGRKNSREYFKQTFYPSVTDVARASVIEVTEGSVMNDVDIVMGRPVSTFIVTGRVVDETGRPVPNIQYGVGQTIQHDQNSSSSSPGTVGNRDLDDTQPAVYRAGDSVKLVLTKGGVITGTVTNQAGEPIVEVNVHALMVHAPNRADSELMYSAPQQIKVRGACVTGIELIVEPLSSVYGPGGAGRNKKHRVH